MIVFGDDVAAIRFWANLRSMAGVIPAVLFTFLVFPLVCIWTILLHLGVSCSIYHLWFT